MSSRIPDCPFSTLPTELVVDIFRFAIAHPKKLGPDHDEGEFYLPRLREKSRTALAISQISQEWRRVALGTAEFWDSIYLNADMCHREGISEILSNLYIDRQNNPLHIDVDCDRPHPHDSTLATSPDPADFTKIISKEMLLRCVSLRLRGSKSGIQSFVTSLLCSLWRPVAQTISLPLRELQLDWVQPPSRCHDSPHIRLPCIKHLSNLVSVRSNGLIFVPFNGRWNVEDMILEGGTGCFQNYIFWRNRLKRLTLRNLEVSSLRDLYLNLATATHLEYLELDSLYISPFRKASQGEFYAKFYTGIFISLGIAKTLKKLKLANLSTLAWGTLKAVLDKHEAEFSLVESLFLSDIAVQSGDSDSVLITLWKSFPGVRYLALKNMGQVGDHLMEQCRASHLGLWPSVREVRCDDRFLWRRH